MRDEVVIREVPAISERHLPCTVIPVSSLGPQRLVLSTSVSWAGGGIGRRSGLKIRCPQGREGSSPSPPTIIIEEYPGA